SSPPTSSLPPAYVQPPSRLPPASLQPTSSLPPAYLQGTSLFLRAWSSRCRSLAVGRFLVARSGSGLPGSPQLYAQRAAPACCLQAVTCRSLRSRSVLYARCLSIPHLPASRRPSCREQAFTSRLLEHVQHVLPPRSRRIEGYK